MNEFSKIVCWNETAVLASTPRDAASLSSAHFRAVHHPLKLKRRQLEARRGGTWVNEHEIVRVLEGPLRPDGYLLVPVVGGSGTGKSHLVRWVFEHTRSHENWVVRYLAKNRTSIRRVIEIVIDGMQGPAVDMAREALESAPAHTESEWVLAQRLLDELALITSEEGPRNSGLDQESEQRLAKLRMELPDVLRDPVVRRRLMEEGAAIPRLVGLAMRGRRDGDGLDDDAARIAEGDLPRSFDEIGDVSGRAKALLLHLATIPDLATDAVNLINDALPSAVKRVFVSNQVDLIEVFREVRKALLVDNKELVLYIEDLTVLHGVEREFLDAIVEPAKSADGELCNLRVLFAVTDGHFRFDDLDTVRTRCDDAYWLDATYGSGGVDLEEAASFLGRYLNACRHDPEQLESEWSKGGFDNQVSSKCDDCSFRIDCHETFGVSTEGFGLYPFNLPAIDKLVTSLSTDRFDPRVVVRELVNTFLLLGGSDISRGEFPSDGQFGVFDKKSDPVDPLTVADLRSKRPGDYKRIVNVLRYWSENGLEVGDAILGAFGLAPLERVNPEQTRKPIKRKPPGSQKETKKEPGSHDGETSVEDRLQSKWKNAYTELTYWSGNQRDLSAAATNHLRKLVHEVVIKNLDFGPLPVNLGKDFETLRFGVRDIYISGSVTDQGIPQNAVIVIERDSSSASALQGLILLAELPNGDYPREDLSRQEAARCIEEWTQAAKSSLEQALASDVVAAIQGLVLSSVILGNCEGAKESNDYLKMIFVNRGQVDDHKRGEKWESLVADAEVTYHRLRPTIVTYFGVARGSGAPRAIRADLLLETIHSFTTDWHLKSSDSAVDRLMRSVVPALDAEWAQLMDKVEGAAPLLDPDRGWKEQASRVLELVDDAHRSGRLNDLDAKRDLSDLFERTEDDSHRSIFRGTELVSSELLIGQRLAIVAGQLHANAATVSRFIARAQQVMDMISSDLNERMSAEAEDDDLEDAVNGVFAATTRVAEAMEAVSQ